MTGGLGRNQQLETVRLSLCRVFGSRTASRPVACFFWRRHPGFFPSDIRHWVRDVFCKRPARKAPRATKERRGPPSRDSASHDRLSVIFGSGNRSTPRAVRRVARELRPARQLQSQPGFKSRAERHAPDPFNCPRTTPLMASLLRRTISFLYKCRNCQAASDLSSDWSAPF